MLPLTVFLKITIITMRIVFRNFVRLLSAGAFNTEETVERMSVFKWRQILNLAETSNVSEYISSGLVASYEQDKTAIPYYIIEESASKAAKKDTSEQKTDGSNKFTRLPIKKFANFYLNHKFNKIIFNEIHSIDTSVDTLTFLCKLVDNANLLLNKGIDLKELAELGLFLRKNGNKIDFIKIERWVKLLKMKRISDLIGSCLITLFSFDAQEIPFLKKPDKKTERYILTYLSASLYGKKNERKIEKRDDEETESLIHKPGKIATGYFSYCPLEASSISFARVIKSLSNIEE